MYVRYGYVILMDHASSLDTAQGLVNDTKRMDLLSILLASPGLDAVASFSLPKHEIAFCGQNQVQFAHGEFSQWLSNVHILPQTSRF